MSNPLIRRHLSESAEIKLKLAETQAETIDAMANAIIDALEGGGKVMICGNGGSAADSQHIAAELVGRFKKHRKGLAAMALTTDTSILTSLGNDYGFDSVFSRQVESLGKPGDVLVGISTSGKSPNVVQALQQAKSMGLKTAVLLGASKGPMTNLADIAVCVPTTDTARIQECHITVGHIICDLVESRFSEKT